MFDHRIAISYKTRRLLSEHSQYLPYGAAHYSYRSVKEKFSQCFELYGIRYFELDRPEIYPVGRDIYNNVAHIQFKPFEEIRLLRGVPNVAHVAWEFPVLPTERYWATGDLRRTQPLEDYVHMLDILDEVWVGSEYAQQVLSAHGVQNVYVVPAPVLFSAATQGRNHSSNYERIDPMIAGFASRLKRVRSVELTRNNIRDLNEGVQFTESVALSDVLTRHRRVFILVANPGDMRKNLPAALLAMRSIPKADDVCLVIKFVIDNKIVDLKSAVFDVLKARFQELEYDFFDQDFPGVYIFSDVLSEGELSAFYSCAHFYLCPAFAEGQNLPILEAMAKGVIPVSVNHTAMADYVSESNSFIIESKSLPAPKCFESAYGMANMSINISTHKDVAAAIERALGSDDDEIGGKSVVAIETINLGYSARNVINIVDLRLSALRGV